MDNVQTGVFVEVKKQDTENLPRAKFLHTLFQELVPLQLPIGSYIIAGSGPLAIRNMREAADVDILVDEPLWASLQLLHTVSGDRRNRIALGTIEIRKDWMILTDKIEEMIAHHDMIDGFPFMKLSYVIDTKKYLGRPKDLEDMAMINSYLEKRDIERLL